jgi:murein DD-endopeptidase MepM/ murein hydrolase activator NlpD
MNHLIAILLISLTAGTVFGQRRPVNNRLTKNHYSTIKPKTQRNHFSQTKVKEMMREGKEKIVVKDNYYKKDRFGNYYLAEQKTTVYRRKEREKNSADSTSSFQTQNYNFNTSGKLKTQDYTYQEKEEEAIEENVSLNIPYGNPLAVPISVSSSFGYRTHPIYRTKFFHKGIDLDCNTGTKIFATANGVVELARWGRGYGYYVIINHGNGYKTLYAHLSRIKVQVGKQIKADYLIGYAGNTGLSTGPHLHYEIIKNGKAIDPANYIYKSNPLLTHK